MYYNTKASGARIRELRIAKNFTQDDLAGFISLIESVKKGCSVDLLIQLSEIFDTSLDYLILGRCRDIPDASHLKEDIQHLIGDLESLKEKL